MSQWQRWDLHPAHLASESLLLNMLWTQRKVGQNQDCSRVDLFGDVRKPCECRSEQSQLQTFREETAPHVPEQRPWSTPETHITLLINYCCLVPRLCLTLATPWTVGHQAPLSMGFPWQEYWSGCYFLLREIVWSQGSNLHLPNWQADSLPLSHQGSP